MSPPFPSVPSLTFSIVFLVILSVFFENTGLMKNAPRQSQFEPSEADVKFGDVHGVDEVKDVSAFTPRRRQSNLFL
jgi:hypothetical protein